MKTPKRSKAIHVGGLRQDGHVVLHSTLTTPLADPVCGCDEWTHLPQPLKGLVPFSAPGDPLVIWDGEIVGRRGDGPLVRVPAQINLAWRRSGGLRWAVDKGSLTPEQEQNWRHSFHASKSFHVEFGGELTELDAGMGDEYGGVINGGEVGDREATLDHVIAHWIGFPELIAGEQIHAHIGDGWRTWRGRYRATLHGWQVTFDARPDLQHVLRAARDSDARVVTHVMSIRRADGSGFTPDQAKDLLFGLQCAVSFARGHWACPAVPVGFDASGRAVWSEWHPLFADPPFDGRGWWNAFRVQDLFDAVDKYLTHWFDPTKKRVLRSATINAVSAVETGFVEQRIVTAVSSLEMLSWMTDVIESGVNEERWHKKSAYKRLRKLLLNARIPLAIEPERTPSLAAFASKHSYEDGLEAVVEIRHALMHPKDNEHLYAVDKTLADAARLSLRFLELVILSRIGYEGHAYERTHAGRWAGESQPVPWV